MDRNWKLFWKYGMDVRSDNGRIGIWSHSPHTVSLEPGDALLLAERLIEAAAPLVNNPGKRRKNAQSHRRIHS